MPRNYFRGRYVIRIERKGDALVYDVLTVAAGFDMLNLSEAEALDGIARRFCKGTEV